MDPEIDFFEHFLSEKESSDFFQTLLKGIPWKQKTIRIFGKSVLEPRLTAWYGDPSAAYTYSGTRMLPLAWTSPLLEIKSRIETQCRSSFNSVFLNFYRDQKDSMGMHSDDEKELGAEPVIASLSLGDTRRFILKAKSPKPASTKTYLLKSGDLIIMRGQTQKLWKHGIPKESLLCGPRINLTFRKIIS